MRRQIPILRGLAILAVVLNHAVGWGYTAMFWWTDRYRQVSSLPNYDQLGSPTYYGLLAIQQLALFSVPAFLFISGFFIAYAARGDEATLSWKIVRTRIANLLWPYLVWSVVIFLGDALQGKRHPLMEYGRRLVVGDAVGAYFFVPLLCQFYLLSPLIARWGKKRGGLLLLVSALVQLAALGVLYLPFLGVALPDALYTTGWAFVWHAFYFPLGVICGFRFSHLKSWLARAKWGLVGTTVVLGVLSIVESEAFRLAEVGDWGRSAFKLSTTLYTIAFILSFLAFEKITIPFSQATIWIGAKSYGIYLLHPTVLELAARTAYHIAPWILAHQILYQPVLVALGVGLPILLMVGVMKFRARVVYTYLFG